MLKYLVASMFIFTSCAAGPGTHKQYKYQIFCQTPMGVLAAEVESADYTGDVWRFTVGTDKVLYLSTQHCMVDQTYE